MVAISRMYLLLLRAFPASAAVSFASASASAPVHKSRGDMWPVLAGCPFAAWLVTCWHLRPDTWHFVSALRCFFLFSIFWNPRFAACLCVAYMSLGLYSFRLIRNPQKIWALIIGSDMPTMRLGTFLWAMALSEIYWFLYADQDVTAAQINDEYPEMILQKSFAAKTTDKLDGKIALTIIPGYCTYI